MSDDNCDDADGDVRHDASAVELGGLLNHTDMATWLNGMQVSIRTERLPASSGFIVKEAQGDVNPFTVRVRGKSG